MKMIIRHIENGLVILPASFLLSAGCNKNSTRPCLTEAYAFNATGKWIPEREIYNIGDTIYFESTIPKKLLNLLNSSTIVDYSNSTGIQGDLRINYVDTLLKQNVPGRDSFLFCTISGSFTERLNNNNHGINFNYNETSENYYFKGGLICKKKGLYAIGVSDLISNGIRGKKCTNAGFSMSVTNMDKHLSIYENALGIILDPDGVRRGYVFRVQ